MRLIKIELMYGDKSQGSYVDEMKNITTEDLLDGMEPGQDSYRISVVEMPESYFRELPEFMGF